MVDNNKQESCVVVGAGVIGVLTAFELLNNGFKVTLIDKQEPGTGCSFGNAGHFAPEQVFPMPGPSLIPRIPSMLLNPNGPLVIKPSYFFKFMPWAFRFLWACRKSAFESGTSALMSLNKFALDDWKELLAANALEKYLDHRGTLQIFKSESGVDFAKDAVQNFRKHGVDVDYFTAEKVKEKIPAITDEQYGALFYPETGHCINPFGVVKDFFEKFIKAGGEFLKDDVKQVIKKSSDKSSIILAEKVIDADNVFICAGYLSEKLTKDVGLRAPLVAERGYHIMIPEPGIELEYAITHHDRSFVMTPMEMGIRLAGTVEFANGSDAPTYKRARMLVNFARELLPDLSALGKDEWMGCRPTLPDYLPVIDHRDNIFMAFGHNHLGLTQAATTAKAIVQMKKGEIPAFMRESNGNNPFTVERFN